MFRDKTSLFVSFRQSYARHPVAAFVPESESLIRGADTAIEMDRLPPAWVDIKSDVDDCLKRAQIKMTELEKLHARHALPSFDERSQKADEARIDALQREVTGLFHKCQEHLRKVDAMAKSQSAPDQAIARNLKIALATKIQQISSTFRKQQGAYLKRLQGMSDADSPLNPYDLDSTASAIADDESDLQLSQATLQAQKNPTNTSINQRVDEITQIAEGILELADIFRELQTMVIDQGTLLDRIDYNIENTVVNVKQADKQLIKAERYQKRTTKCRIIFLLVLLIFGLLIILLVRPRHHSTPSSAPAVPDPLKPISSRSLNARYLY
ncbi:hypothetical protein CANCADRAFT_3984 [Tortispora caseinolytica NRRL Y-17796]|uniref:t-SNARE coiled-coil homology domain-containing protein n=1 Tax=Tortispora caseinolytica NRRL Y-17796 TaxID=767744 RepID=A0A1E4TC59_9ASCO|nr:hypothetical protein CANCADRAFT_3984 [Tortispora caseinolytica NRRL Y-17796]